jgi:hypothetical protein
MFWNYGKYNLPSKHMINRFFGSFENMEKECNVVLVRASRAEYLKEHPEIIKKIVDGHDYFTKEDVIKLVKEIFSKEQLTKSDFWNNYNKHNLPSMNVINRLFGNLDNMAIECNIIFKKRDRAKYLAENPEVKNKIITNSNIFKKNIDFNERYGKEHADLIRQKLSDSCKGRIPHNKNRKNIEYYGLEKSLRLKKRNKEHATKYTDEELFDKVRQIVKKYGKISKCDINGKRKEFTLCHVDTLRYRFGTLDNFAKQAGIVFIQPEIIFSNKYNRKKGINEDMILDFVERINDITLHRHPVVFTKSTFRFPDAIDYKNKIIYEVDEKYHNSVKQQINDEIREKEILEIYPNYKFLRLDENEFINRISNEFNINLNNFSLK